MASIKKSEHSYHVCDLLFGITVFVFLFVAIFDVYYTSPLVKDIKPLELNIDSPADTVFLIVSDGVQTERLLGHSIGPNIRHIILHDGVWGLSHTRVPTESRPGHVALLGGFYEDVSSVTKGWQANAVEFDSLFNHTCFAWAWGGPDVVPLFRLPGSPPPTKTSDGGDLYVDERIRIESFPHEILDLEGENATTADEWVFRSFESYFLKHSASMLSHDGKCNGRRRGKLIFLHLNAADQIGHADKPGSERYAQVLRYLDTFIADLRKLVDAEAAKIHPAPKVAYLITSDHGMTNWGSHGSGSIHETTTPLLAWGAGISKPSHIDQAKLTAAERAELRKFGLPEHSFARRRRDTYQANICPLIAGLLGCSIPINSVGEVPIELLDIDKQTAITLTSINCRQLVLQLNAKHAEQRAAHLNFAEFPGLTQKLLHDKLSDAEKLAEAKDERAIDEYRDIMRSTLSALYYYHTYDRLFHGGCVVVSYLLMTVLFSCAMVPVDDAVAASSSSNRAIRLAILCHGVALVALLLQGFLVTWKHFLYQVVPLLLSFQLLGRSVRRRQLRIMLSAGHHVLRTSSENQQLLGLLLLILEFSIFGFSHRPCLSIACILLAMWPWICRQSCRSLSRVAIRCWTVNAALVAVFPMLPVIGSNKSLALVALSTFLPGLFTVFLRWFEEKVLRQQTAESTGPPAWLVAVSSAGGFLAWLTLTDKRFNGLLVNLFSWSSLALPIIVKLFDASGSPRQQLVKYALAFCVPFQLMSLCYEGFFFWLLVGLVYQWIGMETNLVQAGAPKSPLEPVRRAIFTLFLVVLAFFGTGNVASINSFDPESVHCFVTILIPAIMGPLLIYKMLCPMVAIGVGAAAVRRLHGEQRVHSLLLLALSNFLAMHFFWWLRDAGSWLDIGISISHYVIAISIGLASIILSLLGAHLLPPPHCSSRGESTIKSM